jgi:hypothetical protein
MANLPLRTGALIAAALLAAGSASAQNADPIGPPQLQNFSLPGERTLAPSPVPSPTPSPSPTPAPSPPVAEAPPAARSITPPSPRREPTVAVPTRVPESTPAPAAVPPIDEPISPEVPLADAVLLPQAAPVLPDAVVPERSGSNWPYFVGAATLALLLAAGILFRRRVRRDEVRSPQERVREPAAVPKAMPAPPPAAAPPSPPPSATGGIVGISLRPRIELEFIPDKMTMSEGDLTIQFDLVIRNSGMTVVSGAEMEARMFNADAQANREVATYQAAPFREPGLMLPGVPPQSSVRVTSNVRLPLAEARAFDMEGRTLFVPIVAINLACRWGAGKTETLSRSFLVGREGQPRTDKMAPFRLDLGPRVYKQIGQRLNQPGYANQGASA